MTEGLSLFLLGMDHYAFGGDDKFFNSIYYRFNTIYCRFNLIGYFLSQCITENNGKFESCKQIVFTVLPAPPPQL